MVSFFVLSASNCSPALALNLASKSFNVGAPPFAKRNSADANLPYLKLQVEVSKEPLTLTYLKDFELDIIY